jgi:hypothetical protein
MFPLILIVIVVFIIYKLSASKRKPGVRDDSFAANGLTPTGGEMKSHSALAKINANTTHGVIGWTLNQLIERYGTENLEKEESSSTTEGVDGPTAVPAIKSIEDRRKSEYGVEGVYRWDIPGRMRFSLDENDIVCDATWFADILADASIAKMADIRKEISSVYGEPHKEGDSDTGYSWDWVSNDDILITLSGTIDDSSGTKRYTDIYLSSSLANAQVKKNLGFA